MPSKRAVGNTGEEAGVQYILKMGFQILSRNYYTRDGEIDIIAQKDGYVVFFEVKYRSSNLFGSPGEAITLKKQARIKLAAMQYIQENGLYDSDLRFDALLVTGKNLDIEHLENVF